MSPKSIKIITTTLLIVVLFFSFIFVLGCSYGPSKEFVQKMDERANQHFPRYRHLLNDASVPQLESILKKEPGTLAKAAKEDIDFLKESLLKEIEAWQYLIETNKKLLEGK